MTKKKKKKKHFNPHLGPINFKDQLEVCMVQPRRSFKYLGLPFSLDIDIFINLKVKPLLEAYHSKVKSWCNITLLLGLIYLNDIVSPMLRSHSSKGVSLFPVWVSSFSPPSFCTSDCSWPHHLQRVSVVYDTKIAAMASITAATAGIRNTSNFGHLTP